MGRRQPFFSQYRSHFSRKRFGIRGASRKTSARCKVKCQLPFPSGGKSSGSQTRTFLLDGIIFLWKALDAGSRPSFTHIPICNWGYR